MKFRAVVRNWNIGKAETLGDVELVRNFFQIVGVSLSEIHVVV